MTAPVDIEFARTFLKADGDDDDIIAAQLLSATTMCEDYCNRKFYETQEAADEDFTAALAEAADAILAQKNALAGLPTGTDPGYDGMRRMVNDRFRSRFAALKGRVNGIVLDDAINAAICITLGHLYNNREDNVATGNNVVQVPVGAIRILQSKLWIGDLADGVPDGACWGTITEGS